MKFNELGFDFSNANSFIIRKKNNLAIMLFWLLSLIFLFLLITFFTLYILRVPLTNNGVVTNYGEEGYESTFTILFAVFGGLTLLFFILNAIFSFLKPRAYIIKSQDASLKNFYYIYENRSELYLAEDKLLIFNKNTKHLTMETDPEKISLALDRYIFWKKFEDLKNYLIKATNKKTVLKFKEKMSRTVYKATYKFEDLENIVPGKITEIISYSTGGNVRIQRMNVYYIEEINRSQKIEYPQEMLPYINQIN